MVDNRVYTFLKLCETMNYRKAAELLNMTQPAVTQHIQYMEAIYNTKLFNYNKKKLTQTQNGVELEKYLRSLVYNELAFKKQLKQEQKQQLAIGATKTIGDYLMNELILSNLKEKNIELKLIIDNTRHLFKELNNFKLDFLMIEGYFDKNNYDSLLIRNEKIVGICAKEHKFAFREIELEELFSEHIILREEGSGTRKVFENFLTERNYTLDSFNRKSVISSLKLIKEAVLDNIGISFVYETVPSKDSKLAVFEIKGHSISHELNYVYLKNSKALELIHLIEDKNIK